MINKEKTIILAGGHIKCARCQAMNRRKIQCSKPAIRTKNVCSQHGGKSTGAKTIEGKERSRLARIKSGTYTKESKDKYRKTLLNLVIIEDCAYALGLFVGDRTKGRRPLGYLKISDPKQARETIMRIDLRFGRPANK